MTKKTYQPKGGMCVNCYHRIFDCSHLDFSKMHQISKPDKDGIIIVKCSRFSDKKNAIDYEKRFI